MDYISKDVLEECHCSQLPKDLPEPLYDLLLEHIKTVSDLKSGKYKKDAKMAATDSIWGYNQIYELNKVSHYFDKLISYRMVDVWNTLYKQKNCNIRSLFRRIINDIDKSRVKDLGRNYKPKIKELEDVIDKSIFVFDYFVENSTMHIIPDVIESEYDMQDISHDEFDYFMQVFRKVITGYKSYMEYEIECQKRLDKRSEKIFSRKKKMDSASAVSLVRLLRSSFVDFFGKPLNDINAEIVSIIYDNEYSSNDVVKLSKRLKSEDSDEEF